MLEVLQIFGEEKNNDASNFRDIEINAPDKLGNSPLMNACVKGYDE